MRLSEVTILAAIVVQVVGGLGAAWWRSNSRARRGAYIDLTDLTSLSRSVDDIAPR